MQVVEECTSAGTKNRRTGVLTHPAVFLWNLNYGI